MRPFEGSFPDPGVLLLVVASPIEAAAAFAAAGSDAVPTPWTLTAIAPNVELLLCGIGKANAAGAVGRYLDPDRHALVLSVGIAGSLPGSSGFLPIGTVIVATACVYPDEGIETPDGFMDCASLGFPLGNFPGSAVPVSESTIATLRPFADVAGPIATVSTCSGTDSSARRVALRTGAVAEGMEGAAVAQVCRRLDVRVGELRVISNSTGDRGAQRWDVPGAVARLEEVLGRVIRGWADQFI